MSTDPPVKGNGRCRVCDRARPPVAKLHDDPFCSTGCCRQFYRVDG
ncbi:MAG TPA: hypothetical protein VH541_05650 [Gaiellaceae bacterium]